MKRAALLSILIATSAQAEFWDGNRLHAHMNGSNTDKIMALGYVIGVADAIRGVTFCPTSPNITGGQVNDVVKAYLDNAPANRHYTGDVAVGVALSITWPCRGNNRGGNSL